MENKTVHESPAKSKSGTGDKINSDRARSPLADSLRGTRVKRWKLSKHVTQFQRSFVFKRQLIDSTALDMSDCVTYPRLLSKLGAQCEPGCRDKPRPTTDQFFTQTQLDVCLFDGTEIFQSIPKSRIRKCDLSIPTYLLWENIWLPVI